MASDRPAILRERDRRGGSLTVEDLTLEEIDAALATYRADFRANGMPARAFAMARRTVEAEAAHTFCHLAGPNDPTGVKLGLLKRACENHEAQLRVLTEEHASHAAILTQLCLLLGVAHYGELEAAVKQVGAKLRAVEALRDEMRTHEPASRGMWIAKLDAILRGAPQ